MSSSILLCCFSVFLRCCIAEPEMLHQKLSTNEQQSVYTVLETVNPDIDWRSIFPGDLCNSGPHGVYCDFVPETGKFHVTELNFGYVSEYSANPPCGFKANFTPLMASFPFLRKLFFYKCFNNSKVSLQKYLWNVGESLEELVFVENRSLFGKFGREIAKLKGLKRLVLIGSRVSGEIPEEIGDLIELEQLVISGNRFKGNLPKSLERLKKLKLLDLSHNHFEGNLPQGIGGLIQLLKLDLGFNRLNGTVPETLVHLQRLEFMDLSYNRFANCGVPLFLADLQNLKEIHLSGNPLGGHIPEIWAKLGGILGLGLSNLGLVGTIPSSMGLFLRRVNYLGLDNNKLEGNVPAELELLEFVHEINLEKNCLMGKVPFSANFSAKIGAKLKLKGNPDLCIDPSLVSANKGSHLNYLSFCSKPEKPEPVMGSDLPVLSSSSSSSKSTGIFYLVFFNFSVAFLGL